MARNDPILEWNAYRPERMSILVEESGVAKARLPFSKVLILSILAGAFIAFGGAFYLAVIAESEPLTGLVRFAGGIAFSLGLILVIVGGAEEAFARGILCNALVCLAVWMSYSARTAAGKTLVIVFPITAFVALGLEHSIANMFLLPLGILAGAEGSAVSILANLVTVTIGNVVGGAGGVALSYWIAYRNTETSPPER